MNDISIHVCTADDMRADTLGMRPCPGCGHLGYSPHDHEVVDTPTGLVVLWECRWWGYDGDEAAEPEHCDTDDSDDDDGRLVFTDPLELYEQERREAEADDPWELSR